MHMPKIRIHSAVISPEETITKEAIGILQDNKIIYKEDNVDVTILIFDNKIRLSRVSEQYELNMEFIKDEEVPGNYIIEKNINIDLKTKTNILKIDKSNIIIEYELKLADEEIGRFNFEIKYEVI